MVETATLLPFVSILFLIVVELSGRAADSDLEQLAKTKNDYLLGYVPDLGFFSIAHLINVFILMTGHLIVSVEFLSGDDLIVTQIYLATLAFLFIIPYIEIEEYDLLMERSGSSRSWRIHFLMAAAMVFEPYFFIGLGLLPVGNLATNVGAVVFLLTFIIGTLFFLHALRTELQSSTDDILETIDEKVEEQGQDQKEPA